MAASAGSGTTAPWVVWIVVLGDFGRSPRMQYHALSLARKPGVHVVVVAYAGSTPLRQLAEAPNVRLAPVQEPPAWTRILKPRALGLVLRVLLQLLQLLWLLLVSLPRPQRILLQNPPAIPTLAVCWLAARRHGAQLVVDWHNYGYTIMALGQSKGAAHWMVRLARVHERAWGPRADRHFCVTHAMKQDLQDNWAIRNVLVLHDRPPDFFKRTDTRAKHDLLQRLHGALLDPSMDDFYTRWYTRRVPPQQQAMEPRVPGGGSGGMVVASAGLLGPLWGETLLTVCDVAGTCEVVRERPGRPAVVVSSTSWTPDEDFGILLEAAQLYDAAAMAEAQAPGPGTRAGQGQGPGWEAGEGQGGVGKGNATLPPVLFLITGKGPLKDLYLQRLRTLRFQHVAFRTLWLEPSDYPLLLGAADVGVCLHTSSSGLDLPMKVVDMFGSGLPVCAVSYSCIHELVADNRTGLLFTDARGLSAQLQQLLRGFPTHPTALLTRLQQGVADTQQTLRWDSNWDAVAWPILAPQSERCMPDAACVGAVASHYGRVG